MIAWLNPAALWGLAAVLGAVLVHVLFRQRSRRVPFPSLRFVRSSSTAAVRLRRPTDLLLLIVRAAIVALAAAALAQPLLLTPSRMRAWNARVARAIVVDTSESMHEAVAQAAEVVRAESQHASVFVRIDAADLQSGLRQAIAWLGTAPPARREIVVVSDFQRGALTGVDSQGVPTSIGLRFAKVGSLPASREFAAPLLGGDARVRLEGDATSVAITERPERATALEIVAPAGSDERVRALRRVVSAAGTPAPPAGEPVVVCLGGACVPAALQPIARGWMLRAVSAMRQDSDLLAAGQAAGNAHDSPPWVTILQDGMGQPLVRAASAGDRLVIDVAADPAQWLAAAAVRAVLVAQAAGRRLDEQEVQAIPAEAIAAWAREAPLVGPLSEDAWRHAERSDARWCWGMALLLLGAETHLRRARAGAREVQADAA